MLGQWYQIIKLGIPEESIVVLSTSRTLIESMKSMCDKNNTIPIEQFFTVEEFTGLEKFAVILLWSEKMVEKFTEADRYRRAYQGTGRAEEVLRIVSSAQKNEFYQNEEYLKTNK